MPSQHHWQYHAKPILPIGREAASEAALRHRQAFANAHAESILADTGGAFKPPVAKDNSRREGKQIKGEREIKKLRDSGGERKKWIDRVGWAMV